VGPRAGLDWRKISSPPGFDHGIISVYRRLTEEQRYNFFYSANLTGSYILTPNAIEMFHGERNALEYCCWYVLEWFCRNIN